MNGRLYNKTATYRTKRPTSLFYCVSHYHAANLTDEPGGVVAGPDGSGPAVSAKHNKMCSQ